MTAEEQVRKMFGAQILSAMKNKESIVRELLRILEEQNIVMNGLDNFVKAVDDGKTSNAQLGGMVKTMCRSIKAQSNAIRQLSMSTLAYIVSDTFTADCATVANTMGPEFGQQALRDA